MSLTRRLVILVLIAVIGLVAAAVALVRLQLQSASARERAAFAQGELVTGELLAKWQALNRDATHEGALASSLAPLAPVVSTLIAPLLDASGWAINGKAMINVPFGGALTTTATLPEGAKRSLKDPFAPKPSRLPIYLFLLALLCTGVSWYLGKLDAYLPAAAKSTAVLGDQAPAAATAAPSAAK